MKSGVYLLPWYYRERDNIKSVIIENGVTNIGNFAFFECSNLTSIKIPNSVISIGNSVFDKCSSLISIEIPSSVTSICDLEFDKCTSLTSIEVNKDNSNYMDDNGVLYTKDQTELLRYPAGKTGTEYVILNSVTSIGNRAFYECSSLTSIEISNGVTSIGDFAFSGCTSLEVIQISNNVMSIGREAFYKCSSLTSIKIPNSVTSIGSYAFSKCSSLTSIEISNSVTSIEVGTFSDCTSLISIEIPSSVTDINAIALDGCSSLTNIKVNEDNPMYMENNGILYTKDKTKIIRYPGGKAETEYVILSGTTSIGKYAFSGCSNLISIKIENGVTSIEWGAFFCCTSLTRIEIPNSVNSINGAAFFKCTSLTSIKIPSSLTNIEEKTFYECTNLTSIKIPNSVKSIGNYAFEKCTSLSIICKSDTIAETYAKENDIDYQIDDQAPNISINQNGTKTMMKSATTTVTITDDLSGLDESNLKYLWSEKENNIVKENLTNELKIGETLEIKEKTGIFYLWIYTIDMVGNEIIQRSDAFYIDNTTPTANVTYSLSSNKDKNTVTIKANEKLQTVTGWTLSGYGLALTKTYAENTGVNGENVVIKDIAGNSTTVNIRVTGIEKVFKLIQYEIKDKYITKIQPNTKYEDFVKNVQANIDYTIKEGEKIANSTSIMKTGQVLTVENESYTIVVTGDCNGDGKAELRDILAINKHRLNKSRLTAEYLQGADANGDGKVDLKDILLINKFRLGKIQQL